MTINFAFVQSWQLFPFFKFFLAVSFFQSGYNTFIAKTNWVISAQGRVKNLEIRKNAIKKILRNFDGWNGSDFKKHWELNTELVS